MKVLVATGATQGYRPDDFNGCVEGELLWMRAACPGSYRTGRKKCPCGRSFSGMSSMKNTSTALVREVPGLTRDEFEQALRASFDTADWCPCCTTKPVAHFVDEMLAFAGLFPVGAVVERRRDGLRVRTVFRSIFERQGGPGIDAA